MADFKKLKDGQGNSYNVKDETARTNLASHTGNTSNPHSVTKAQVGLGNVDNTSDANKPISNAQSAVNATKFDKENVKATPASTPSNDNVVSEKYSEETYAKKDGYYETFGYAREAGIAKNLQNDEGKLLDPDVETSSGTIYADQPFTQRATAMTMNAYLNNELITVGSGYEQWKKEQAFSIVRNNQAPHTNGGTNGITATYDPSTRIFTLSGTSTNDYTNLSDFPTSFYGHKILMMFQLISNPNNVSEIKYSYFNQATEQIITNGVIGTYGVIISPSSSKARAQGITGFSTGTDLTGIQFRIIQIDLTQWFASRPEIAEALNGDAGIKWFLQNYPQATTLGYDEGTIVDTEDYEYQTTGVNLWDEEWESGSFNWTTGEKAPMQGRCRSKNLIRVFPNTEYYVGTVVITVLSYDDNGNFIKQLSKPNNIITTPINCSFIHICWNGTTYNHDIQICNHFTETSVENTYHKYEIYKDKVSWAFTSTGKGKSAGKAADTKDYVNKKNIEKVGSVDLGTLNWTYESLRFRARLDDARVQETYVLPNAIISNGYTLQTASTNFDNVDDSYTIFKPENVKYIIVKDNSYTDAATFKAAMSGVYLNYELATYIETDMTGDELDTNIPENDYGVERKVPVSGNMFSGSSTTIFYQDNVLRQIYNNKTSIDNLQAKVNNIETRIPTAPTTDGTYTLKVVVSNGVATYSWTLDSQGA